MRFVYRSDVLETRQFSFYFCNLLSWKFQLWYDLCALIEIADNWIFNSHNSSLVVWNETIINFISLNNQTLKCSIYELFVQLVRFSTLSILNHHFQLNLIWQSREYTASRDRPDQTKQTFEQDYRVSQKKLDTW